MASTILAEEGITALRIDRLGSRLAVTKCGFYWHFTDIPGYRATLIEGWVNCATTTAVISPTWLESRRGNGSRK